MAGVQKLHLDSACTFIRHLVSPHNACLEAFDFNHCKHVKTATENCRGWSMKLKMTGLTSCAYFGLVCIRKHFKVLWYLLICCKILICKKFTFISPLFFICRKNFIQSTEKNWECFCSEPAVAWLVNLLQWWATRRQGKRWVNLSSKLHRLQWQEQKTK